MASRSLKTFPRMLGTTRTFTGTTGMRRMFPRTSATSFFFTAALLTSDGQYASVRGRKVFYSVFLSCSMDSRLIGNGFYTFAILASVRIAVRDLHAPVGMALQLLK